MDNKFYIDDFEKFLKDKVDDFKMYPSHRVWHSIYNNMHPGSRWPSISMYITLICTLFLIGYLNTGTTNRSGRQLAQSQKETLSIAANTQANNTKAFSTITTSSSDIAVPLPGAKNKQQQTAANDQTTNTSNTNNISLLFQQADITSEQSSINLNYRDGDNLTSAELSKSTAPITPASVNNITNNISIENATALSLNNEVSAGSINNNISSAAVLQKNIVPVTPLAVLTDYEKPAITAIVNTNADNSNLAKPAVINQLSETDKSWIENYAMYNRPAPKKWKGKLSMQVYFTPSVVYRNLQNSAGKNASSNLTSSVNNSDISSFVNHTPSFGLETGTALVYDLFKNVKITTGLQLNYTRYNVHAFNNYHPSLTSLTMNNENGLSYAAYRSSDYSNFYGVDGVKLHSQTYQLSIPVGVNLRLASIDNRIDWYAGATVQPSFVFGGKSFLLSSDTRSYVPTTEFMNHFNVNTGLETFLSIKTKTGYTWNIGPQFRRQVFSTNSKVYSIQEKLVSYGIKLGISKKL